MKKYLYLIKIDHEANPETWWDVAQRLTESLANPMCKIVNNDKCTKEIQHRYKNFFDNLPRWTRNELKRYLCHDEFYTNSTKIYKAFDKLNSFISELEELPEYCNGAYLLQEEED